MPNDSVCLQLVLLPGMASIYSNYFVVEGIQLFDKPFSGEQLDSKKVVLLKDPDSIIENQFNLGIKNRPLFSANPFAYNRLYR
jgi:hypothetical protein